MPAASTASGIPAFGPTGAPAIRDITHRAAELVLPTTPVASTSVPGRDHAMKPHNNWNVAIEAKNTPDGIQSFQCVGATAK